MGARNRATVACEALLDGEAEAVTRKAIELAKAGDATAIRLCLERILPARRGRPVAIELPSVTTAAELPRLMQAILAAVSAGDITPEEAGALTGLAEQTRRAFELADFDARIRALEATQ